VNLSFKKLALLFVILFSLAACAQNADNIYAAGISYNQGSSPQIAGTALWAHAVSDSGTYAFTVVDILPLGYHPFAVTTNVGVGVAQKLFVVHGLNVYGSGSAGLSVNGANTGWAWTSGALMDVPVKGKYHLMPNVRLLKSSIGNGAGYQPIIGVLYKF
jgi:hypothetical protein